VTAPRTLAQVAQQLRADAGLLRDVAARLDDLSTDRRVEASAHRLRASAADCRWRATELEVLAERIDAARAVSRS
jgi:hypothetical protein